MIFVAFIKVSIMMKRIVRSRNAQKDERPPLKVRIVDRLSLKLKAEPGTSKKITKEDNKKEEKQVLIDGKLMHVKIEVEENAMMDDNYNGFEWSTSDLKALKKGPSRIKTEVDDDSDYDPEQAELDLATQFNGRSTRTRKRKLVAIGWKSDEEEEEFWTRYQARKMAATEPEYYEDIPYLDNPPAGVLGAHKGADKGLPKYEFGSVYQYQIPELDAKNPTPWCQDPSVPPRYLKPNILSVVGSVSLGRALDLEQIAIRATNLSYNPDSGFTPLVMRIKQPRSTALIFKSGRMVVTGTKSKNDCLNAATQFAKQIKKAMHYRVSLIGFQIQNYAATGNLGFRVRVHLMGRDKQLSKQTSYNPEVFSGVTIPLSYPRAKVMVFRTGAVLITGAKSEEDVYKAFEIVYTQAKIYAN